MLLYLVIIERIGYIVEREWLVVTVMPLEQTHLHGLSSLVLSWLVPIRWVNNVYLRLSLRTLHWHLWWLTLLDLCGVQFIAHGSWYGYGVIAYAVVWLWSDSLLDLQENIVFDPTLPLLESVYRLSTLAYGRLVPWCKAVNKPVTPPAISVAAIFIPPGKVNEKRSEKLRDPGFYG